MKRNLILKTTAIVTLMMLILPMGLMMLPSITPTTFAAGIIPTTAYTAECIPYTSPYNGTGWGTVPPSKAIDGVITDASRWAFGSSSYTANTIVTKFVTYDLGSSQTFNKIYFYLDRVASTGFSYQSASLSYGDTAATGTAAPAMTFTTNAADNITNSGQTIQKFTTDNLSSAITARYVKFTFSYKNTSGVTKTAMPAVVEIGLENIAGAVPVASNVSISGTAGVGNLLTGSYTYTSSVAQGASLLQWQECATLGGSYTNISGANSLTFSPTQAQIGKFIQFRVTPVDTNSVAGTPVSSSATNQIGGTLTTPPLPTIPGKTCDFVASAGATSHTIEISKADVGVVGTITNAVSPQDFTSVIVENGAGSYSVTVQAIGDGITFTSSAKSGVATKSFFTVTYHENMGIGTVPTDATIFTIGSFIVFKENTLTRTGYTFAGYATEPGVDGAGAGTLFPTTMSPWRTSPGASSPFVLDLYAYWTINNYAVTFDSQDGSAVTGTTANYNTKITAPTAPTKTDNAFGGWFKDSDCTTAWTFETDVITEETTLYAKWLPISLTGNLIINTPVESNGIVTISIENVTLSDINGVIVIGSFATSAMNAVTTNPIVIKPGINTYKINMSQFEQYVGSTTRMFVFNNLTSLQPYCWNTDF